jgi:hypothetical protein
MDLLAQIDPDMVIAIRGQNEYFFDIDISESYDTILDRPSLVLEGM